jgi:hypothetical protein
MSDNLAQNMKNEEFSSQLSIYFERPMGFRSKRTFILG